MANNDKIPNSNYGYGSGNNEDFDEFSYLDDIDENQIDDYQDERMDLVMSELAELKEMIQKYPATKAIPETSQKNAVTYERTAADAPVMRTSDDNYAKTVTGEEVPGGIDGLIESNRRLMRAVSRGEERLSSEMAALKKQFTLLTTDELYGAIKTIKSNVKNSEEFILNINSTLDGLTEKMKNVSSSDGMVSAEILRQFYEIKNIIGSASALKTKRDEELFELYNLLNKVKYDVKNKLLSVGEKLASVDELVKRLNDTTEFEIEPIAESLNKIIADINCMPLDKQTYDSIIDYAARTENFHLPAARRESVKSYMDSVAGAVKDGILESVDDLPDLITLKNEIEDYRNEFECENLYSSILNINISLLSEKDPRSVKKLRKDLKKQIQSLTSLEVRDLINYPEVSVNKAFRQTKPVDGTSIFDKINEIKNFILDYKITSAGGAVTAQPASGISSELTNIKNELAALGGLDAISQTVLDIKGDCLTILDKLSQVKTEEYSASSSDAKTEVVAGAPSLNEIVEQLDRLFDDVRNIVTESENNLISNLEAINDFIVKFREDYDSNNEKVQKAIEDYKTDSKTIKDDVNAIKENLFSGLGEAAVPVAITSGLSERLDAIEHNTADDGTLDAIAGIDKRTGEISDEVTSLKTEIAELKTEIAELKEIAGGDLIKEIKQLRDQIFAVSMANVSDESGKEAYESYNNLILDEIYSLRDQLSAEQNENDNVETQKIAGEIADLKKEIASTLNRATASDEYLAELTNIKEALKNSTSSLDNEQLMRELSELKDEINAIKPADGEAVSATAINDGINSLKSELSQIAELVDKPKIQRNPKPKKEPIKFTYKIPSRQKKTVNNIADNSAVSALLSKISNAEIKSDLD